MVHGEFIPKENILKYIQGLGEVIESVDNNKNFIPAIDCTPYIKLEKSLPRTEIDTMLKNMDNTAIEFLKAGLYISKSYKLHKMLKDISQ